MLAQKTIGTAGVVGAGVQARYQLEALLQVRNPGRILVAARKPAQAEAYAREMSERLGRTIEVAPSIEALVRQSNLIITATPADSPIVRAEWVQPGTHITAMGSDIPHKRELDAALLGRAKVVVDRISQCLTQGELHHAVDAGVISAADVYAELGEIAAGMKPGRTSETEITIADLTGVGVLDAAVANVVADAAERQGVGRWIDA